MKRVFKFWKIILFDTIGVLLMIAAPFTGVLPGPGGLPVFILGLSLVAVHHDWAKRYIVLLKKYANKMGDYIFVKNRRIQLAYDIFAPLLIIIGVFLLYRRSAIWMISLGIFAVFTGLTFLLCNRGRWHRIKKQVLSR